MSKSQAFRWSDAPQGVAARLGAPPRLDPIAFEDQLEVLDYSVIHLPVLADPEPGRFAHPGGDPALDQAGLKVVEPNSRRQPGVCATLLTCLARIDAWSRAHPDHKPIIVILDAQAGPARPRLRRWLGAKQPADAPSWDALSLEIRHVLASDRVATDLADARGRLLVIARGGAGPLPDARPFTVPGEAVAVFDADGLLAWRVQRALYEGQTVAVLGAEWDEARNNPAVLGAREAAALGAQIITVTHDAARQTPR